MQACSVHSRRFRLLQQCVTRSSKSSETAAGRETAGPTAVRTRQAMDVCWNGSNVKGYSLAIFPLYIGWSSVPVDDEEESQRRVDFAAAS
jgi:hypothetical protein